MAPPGHLPDRNPYRIQPVRSRITIGGPISREMEGVFAHAKVKFSCDGGTCYGWIRFDANDPCVKEWAAGATPEDHIKTGGTTLQARHLRLHRTGPNGKGIRPITNISRRTKAVWNILSQVGRQCAVVGWWPSHPVEPINGVMVSNHYQQASGPKNKPWPLRPGTVHPPRIAKNLGDLRVHPHDLAEGHIDVVAGGYILHDIMLGRLLKAAGDDADDADA